MVGGAGKDDGMKRDEALARLR
ncbi:MAG: hypothetical protein K0Q71_6183, partial [Thermomicrobiales bacterium]|nr:hypothetical protein [Thermomicrobiales bacterium]